MLTVFQKEFPSSWVLETVYDILLAFSWLTAVLHFPRGPILYCARSRSSSECLVIQVCTQMTDRRRTDVAYCVSMHWQGKESFNSRNLPPNECKC